RGSDLTEETLRRLELKVAAVLVAGQPSGVGQLDVDLGGVGADAERLHDGQRLLQLGASRLRFAGGDEGPSELMPSLRLVETGAHSDRRLDALRRADPGSDDIALAGLRHGPGWTAGDHVGEEDGDLLALAGLSPRHGLS